MDNEKEQMKAEVSEQSEAEKLAEEIVNGAAAAEPETAPEAPAEEPTEPTEEPADGARKKPPVWLWIVIAAVVIAAAVALVVLLPGSPSTDEPVSEPSVAPTTTPTTEVSIVRVENPINFAELQEQCDDIVAWVSVPNTNVDYPVVQSSQDEPEDFYLHRNLDKEYEFAGTIYIQKLNDKAFTDPHTVLYGHAMLNGTMFKTLHNFKEKEFFDENDTFTVYIPEHILTYKIFAAYQYDDRHLLYSFDTKNKKSFEEYLTIAQHPTESMQNTREVPLTADDRIVTLSTCLKANAPIRYLVQGVLIKDELTY